MSGFSPTVGEVFVSENDQVGAAQAVQNNPDGSLTIMQVEHGQPDYINTITIDAVMPNQAAMVTYGNVTEHVITTAYQITIDAFFFTATSTMYLLGTDGSTALIDLPPQPVNNIVLSSVGQSIGTVSETFTPSFTEVACFAAGTRILTPEGELPVEALREGQRVVTASGGIERVRWLGHRRIDCRRHPRPRDVWPVRVRRGAFGRDLPHRDLLLSPDHAVYVAAGSPSGGATASWSAGPVVKALIPVRCLVNGASIVQEPVETVTYWHVELPTHDVLLAEGLPAESYLDTGNRHAFATAGDVAEVAAPGSAQPDFYCRAGHRFAGSSRTRKGSAPAGSLIEAGKLSGFFTTAPCGPAGYGRNDAVPAPDSAGSADSPAMPGPVAPRTLPDSVRVADGGAPRVGKLYTGASWPAAARL